MATDSKPALKRNQVTLHLMKEDADLLLGGLDLLPKERRTAVYDRLRANVTNVRTLWTNVERSRAQIRVAKRAAGGEK